MSRIALTIVVAMLAVAAGGCGRDDGGDPAAPVARDTPDDAQGWMRDNPTEIRAFDEQLRPLGLRVARAGVTAGYGAEEYETEGKHLAVYVEPVGVASPDDYVNRIAPLAKVFLPSVFIEHPEIESFDVCQEPAPPHDEVPTPVTQLLVRRDQVRAVDWATADLAALVAASQATPNLVTLAVTGVAATSSTWRAATSRDAVDRS